MWWLRFGATSDLDARGGVRGRWGEEVKVMHKVPLKALRGVGTRLRGVGDEFYSSDLPTYLTLAAAMTR